MFCVSKGKQHGIILMVKLCTDGSIALKRWWSALVKVGYALSLATIADIAWVINYDVGKNCAPIILCSGD